MRRLGCCGGLVPAPKLSAWNASRREGNLMAATYDRAAESLGNILHMEHVNLLIPDQQPAITFYVSGLRYTRDPFLMVGLENMWVNMGRSQMHLPCRNPSPQLLRGTIGMVVPDLNRGR